MWDAAEAGRDSEYVKASPEAHLLEHDEVLSFMETRRLYGRGIGWVGAHIARHGVEPEEVEEIVYEDCHSSWIVRARRRGVPDARWMVFGQTCGDRYLVTIIAPYPAEVFGEP